MIFKGVIVKLIVDILIVIIEVRGKWVVIDIIIILKNFVIFSENMF